jgi:hypothetical protein
MADLDEQKTETSKFVDIVLQNIAQSEESRIHFVKTTFTRFFGTQTALLDISGKLEQTQTAFDSIDA